MADVKAIKDKPEIVKDPRPAPKNGPTREDYVLAAIAAVPHRSSNTIEDIADQAIAIGDTIFKKMQKK